MTITTTAINLSSVITSTAVKQTGELENYVFSLNKDGSETESVNGSSKFYEISVEAFGRTFVVAAHEEHDGEVVVPSNGNLGAEAVAPSQRYLLGQERDDGIKACEGYFELMQAIADKHLGTSVDADDYPDELPVAVTDLHKALKEYLTVRLIEDEGVVIA